MTAPIIVPIVGDTTGLDVSLASAQTKIGRFAGIAKGFVVGLATSFVATNAFDFIGDAVKSFDDLGDANTVLAARLGDSAAAIVALEDSFTGFGLNTGEVAALAVRIAELGTAAQLTGPQIAAFVGPTIEVAGAIERLTGTDAASTIDAIGRAATTGNLKALQALGVSLSDAAVNARALADTGKVLPGSLTDNEKASARWELILEQLNPQLLAFSAGTKDVGDKQAILQAKLDNITTKIGGFLEGPLGDLLDWAGSLLDNVLALTDAWVKFNEQLRATTNFKFPTFTLPGLPGGIPGFPGGPGAGGDTITYNLNTAADPSAVVRALRAWARDNGGREAVFKGV